MILRFPGGRKDEAMRSHRCGAEVVSRILGLSSAFDMSMMWVGIRAYVTGDVISCQLIIHAVVGEAGRVSLNHVGSCSGIPCCDDDMDLSTIVGEEKRSAL